MSGISKSTITYLKNLSQNNNRDWFNQNKDRYTLAHEDMVGFADEVIAEMNKVDQIETPNGKKSLFRIYRDVRFSADKSPYKKNFAGRMRRATAHLRGGYYYHIQPGGSFAAGGFWRPSAEDLKRIRDEFHRDDETIRKVLESKKFKKYFGELKGESVKTAPKGFSKDDPAIDLIRHKSFVAIREFSDREVTDSNFSKELVTTFHAMRPFFNYMSEVLTTDLDGRSTV